MPRVLWLTLQVGDLGEVQPYPANGDEVRLALEFLECACETRIALGQAISRWLPRLNNGPRVGCRTIPCRRPLGLFVLIPEQFARWLAEVLEGATELVQHVRSQLNAWLTGRDNFDHVVA